MQVLNNLINESNTDLKNISTNKNSNIFLKILAQKKENNSNVSGENELLSTVKSILLKINKGNNIEVTNFLKTNRINITSFINYCKNMLNSSAALENISKDLNISEGLCKKYIVNIMQNFIGIKDNETYISNKNVEVGSKTTLPFIFNKIKSSVANSMEDLSKTVKLDKASSSKKKEKNKNDTDNVSNAMFIYAIYLSFTNKNNITKKEDISTNISKFKNILSNDDNINKLIEKITNGTSDTFKDIVQKSDELLNQSNFKNIVNDFKNVLTNIDISKLNTYINKIKKALLKNNNDINSNASTNFAFKNKNITMQSLDRNFNNSNFNDDVFLKKLDSSNKDLKFSKDSKEQLGKFQISSPTVSENIMINTDLLNTVYINKKEFIKDVKNSIKTAMTSHQDNNINKIEINLNPKELGNMEINFQKKNDSIDINFKVMDNNTKNIIQNSINELKKELPNSNVNINFSNFSGFANSSDSGQSQHYKQFNEFENIQTAISYKDKKENIKSEDNYFTNTEFFI